MEDTGSHVYFEPIAGTCPHCVQPTTALCLDAEGQGRCWRCRERYFAEDISDRVRCTPEGLVLVDGHMLIAYRGMAVSVRVPAAVTLVADCCFRGNRNLRYIELPGVLKVGRSAFRRCTGLSEVRFGEALETLAERAFDGCSSLERAALPRSVRSVGRQTFRDCLALDHPAFPDGCAVAEDVFAISSCHFSASRSDGHDAAVRGHGPGRRPRGLYR